jgi:hypothetical protein
MSKRFLTPLGLLSATSDPVSASTGDVYFNSSSNVTRVYYGSAWVNLSASSNVTASIDAGGITSGTLSVARGGTGVTSSTGTGSVVLSNNSTLTGILNAASATFSGTLTASNVNISGSITTASLTSTFGTIAGWTLSASALTAGTGASTVGLVSAPQSNNIAIYAGSTTASAAPFRVTQTGSAFATTKETGDSSTSLATTAFVSNMVRYNGALNTTISATAGIYGFSVSPGTALNGCIITNRSGGAVNRVHSAQVNVALNGSTASNGFVRGYVETNGGAAVSAAGNVFLYYMAW